ncbi:hypothetical protein EHX26_00260 [Brochothrix thermosphacta]|uniref:hypothetical protein n=1 Tax=Brochothrix thermosphacta TaxID=2756 RepID=UPI00083F6008|nr:hypothetical protein [Brochothrix thermosphacta]MPQ27546.1 hypothetical protein [Brochothrix thermosphacta]ODJ55819.1 hypothetical protein BFR38_07500 [Brochothrix thermosphacta]
MNTREKKREIRIKIADLYEGHEEIGFISMVNCNCAVCEEIRELGKELELMESEIAPRVHKRYKICIQWKDLGFSTMNFSSLTEASIFIGKSKSYLHGYVNKGVTNLRVEKYHVKIE